MINTRFTAPLSMSVYVDDVLTDATLMTLMRLR
ncbi:hypothetical protein MLGJGCBP_03075 [Rhodococcus sp. T7]|nr:hypothetical protein MLGJGCBP_03075 [Rhodococcus sp. T7]